MYIKLVDLIMEVEKNTRPKEITALRQKAGFTVWGEKINKEPIIIISYSIRFRTVVSANPEIAIAIKISEKAERYFTVGFGDFMFLNKKYPITKKTTIEKAVSNKLNPNCRTSV